MQSHGRPPVFALLVLATPLVTNAAYAQTPPPTASAPPTDPAQRSSDYFTDGAAALSVPTEGPASEYFTNGASVTSVPTTGPPPSTSRTARPSSPSRRRPS
jgi:hypothetical protein